jgi:hypothetical protein
MTKEGVLFSMGSRAIKIAIWGVGTLMLLCTLIEQVTG